MSKFRRVRVFGLLALFIASASLSARAEEIKTVFVIAMENHNWTQPANQFTGSIQQILSEPGRAVHQQSRRWHGGRVRQRLTSSTSASRSPTPRTTTASSPPRTETILIFILPSRTTSGRKRAPISVCSTTMIRLFAKGRT